MFRHSLLQKDGVLQKQWLKFELSWKLLYVVNDVVKTDFEEGVSFFISKEFGDSRLHVFESALKHDKLEVRDIVAHRRRASPTSSTKAHIREKQVLKRVMEKMHPLSETKVRAAAYHGSLRCLEYVLQSVKGTACAETVLFQAIGGEKIDNVMYSCEVLGQVPTYRCMAAATRASDPKFLVYLVSRGGIISSGLLEEAIDASTLDTVYLLCETYGLKPSRENCFHACNDENILKYFYRICPRCSVFLRFAA